MRPEDVQIPEDALSESFLAATGPGGQNVNKVATAVQLRADVFRLGLHPDVYERLKRLAGRGADHDEWNDIGVGRNRQDWQTNRRATYTATAAGPDWFSVG